MAFKIVKHKKQKQTLQEKHRPITLEEKKKKSEIRITASILKQDQTHKRLKRMLIIMTIHAHCALDLARDHAP